MKRIIEHPVRRHASAIENLSTASREALQTQTAGRRCLSSHNLRFPLI
jgi:hypothetical protein